MRLILIVLCVVMILDCSFAPPVTPEKSKDEDSEIKDNLDQYMEYHRYLKEVVQALESDPEFRERLEAADEEDVRSGKIAHQLDFVSHNVRSKLDEIKRREMERLRHLATKQFELTNDLNTNAGKVDHSPSKEHLDHSNPHTFEIEDLKKLIKKTTDDLEQADMARKAQFKEYEMEKEFEKKQKLENLDEKAKQEFVENLNKEEEAKKHHRPLHHPGSKQQLEEVWEKQDHMDQQFDPKAFFMMHDVDGNGAWDADEVKALFIKELDKLYGPEGPNKDLHERAEEMERMREHVFKENDKNHDGLIDINEFLMETQKVEFNRDEGWKSLDENQIYTQQEYQEYERRKLDELRYLQSRGLVDAHGRPLPGTHHQINEALRQYHAAYQQQMHNQQYAQAQYHGQQYHGQAPQGYPQGQQYQIPQGHPAQQQPPQGQFNAPPQGQFQAQLGQHPVQQPYQGQYPEQQGQILPQGQYQGQHQTQEQYQAQQQPQSQNQGAKQPQGQQQPQGQYQGQQQPQGQYQGQQQPQGQYQGQQQPQGQYQGQQPQGQAQNQPQGQPSHVPQTQQYQGQQQTSQNVNVNHDQVPPVQNAAPAQTGQQMPTSQDHRQPPVQVQSQQASPQASQGQAPPAQAPNH